MSTSDSKLLPRRRFRPSVVILVAAVLATAAQAMIIEMSLPELVGNSELVVAGEVTGTSCRWSDSDRGLIVTDVVIEVQETWMGAYDSSQILVTTAGGEIGDLGLYVEDQPRFKSGRSVVVFLSPANRRGERVVTNLYHGAYTIREGRVTETGESAAAFRSRIDHVVRAREQEER